LIAGRLSTASAKDELVKLATRSQQSAETRHDLDFRQYGRPGLHNSRHVSYPIVDIRSGVSAARRGDTARRPRRARSGLDPTPGGAGFFRGGSTGTSGRIFRANATRSFQSKVKKAKTF